MAKAEQLAQKRDFCPSADTYLQAIKLLRQEGKTAKVVKCQDQLTRIDKIRLTYTLTERELRELIETAAPDVAKALIDRVIREDRLASLDISGKKMYFSDSLNTLYHLYPGFRSKPQAGALGKSRAFHQIMSRYVYAGDAALPGRSLVNPIRYLAEAGMELERNKLPAEGTLQIWLPLPLTSAAQPSVEILDLFPGKYVKYPLKLDGDFGLAYLEVPLAEVKKDLKVGYRIKFTHYEERFKIDPALIGEYDKRSRLYQQYTASDRNTAITPAIRATARRLAGQEKNPWLIAKKFFDHIVWDLDYSYTPHAALEAMKIPESVFVQEHGYGDCGAQSMYFAALCRAAGIPARAPGGYQLFPVSAAGCGSHFWAQVYLPNYGWVPVDTSAGQLGKYMPGLTRRQQQEFADYFFGNMDPFRFLIQTDVDLPLVPPTERELSFQMVVQDPVMYCAEADENPGITFLGAWQMTVKQLK